MARPMVLLALVLLACVPPVSASAADDTAESLAAFGDGGCVHTEDESDEGPVKVGQEEPGVFVGIPGGDQSQDSEGGAEGPFNGIGVFIRNRDCELPAVDEAQELAQQALL